MDVAPEPTARCERPDRELGVDRTLFGPDDDRAAQPVRGRRRRTRRIREAPIDPGDVRHDQPSRMWGAPQAPAKRVQSGYTAVNPAGRCGAHRGRTRTGHDEPPDDRGATAGREPASTGPRPR